MTTYYIVVAHDGHDYWYVPNHDVNKSITTDRNEAEGKAKFWHECNKSIIYTVVEVTL